MDKYKFLKIESKLNLLKSYIRIIRENKDPNYYYLVNYFTEIHNFIVLEFCFLPNSKLYDKLNIVRLYNIEDIASSELRETLSETHSIMWELSRQEEIQEFIDKHPNSKLLDFKKIYDDIQLNNDIKRYNI
jgi:hypothetical protein